MPPPPPPPPPNPSPPCVQALAQLDGLLKRPNAAANAPEVNATVEKYVSNKRAQEGTINEYLDCIEDILCPAAPLQVAFSSGGDLNSIEALLGGDGGAASSMLNAAPPPAGQHSSLVQLANHGTR